MVTFLLDFPENLLTSRWPLNTTENYSGRRVSRILDMDFYEKAPCTRFGEVVYPAPKTTASSLSADVTTFAVREEGVGASRDLIVWGGRV